MATIRVKSANLLRRDTAANWSEKNPILREGEEGYETDTGKRKVGDGTTEWNNLKYDSGIIDQTYNPTSENAQSGKAVAEAVSIEQKRSDNTFANALKGSKSGSAILIDDISPVTHEMGVKVRGKNLFDINGFINLTSNSTYYGINDNGELYVKQSDFRDDTVIPAFVTLEAGTYTLSSTTAITSSFKLINLTDNKTIAFNNNVTFSIEKVTSLGVKCWQSANTVIGKFQLELGTTATAYTPYVPDLTAVKVSRCGKNLFDNNKLSEWGLTLSDGKYTGNVSKLNSKTLFSSFKSNTQYTISAKASNLSKSSASLLIDINYTDGTTQTVIRVNSTTESVYSFTSTANKSISNITFTYYDIDTINIAYIQIEEGTIATEYEPYEGADYTPATDGTVNGVTSLYPNTTLMTDTEGVIIDCEYNRDINKAFAALEAAIATNNS